MCNTRVVPEKLRRWEKHLREFTLPKWDELPTIELYMDQVIVYLSQILDFLPQDEHDDTAVTKGAINNYVRLKIIPPPVKKRYSREHMAYLVMICTLKQSLSIAYVQKMLPVDLSSQELHSIYDSYVEMHRSTCEYFIDQVKLAAKDILTAEEPRDGSVEDLICTAAVVSTFAKLLAMKLLLLKDPPREKAPEKKDSKEKA